MTLNHTDEDRGLHVLEEREVELARTIDSVFRGWAEEVDATERRYPPLIEVSDLQSFDYFENFPHLGLAVAPLQVHAAQAFATESPEALAQIPSGALQPARYALPSAACYSVYLHARGMSVPKSGSRNTLVACCFRNEERYEGLARLLGFTMREVVYIGNEESAKEHLEGFVARLTEFTQALGLPMKLEVATDPFFDKNGSRAKMQRVFPVKREFVVYDVAVGSVNYHRNFFGERCDITLSDGSAAHTSCAAFGIERWVHVLTRHFGDAATALEAVGQWAQSS
jgi:seryl-tRNA synthetase